MLQILPTPNKIVVLEGVYKKGDIIYKKDENIPEEGYRIEINEKGTNIKYSSESGKFYALKTLEQIYNKYKNEIPKIIIEDCPKYKYRGLLWDVSRHFFTINEIKKQLEVLSILKINKFHWHLTDDQGWRIEIKKYPNLTKIGGKREGTTGDKKPVQGYYTQEEIKEFISWCNDRFIEVIPEIDMPGHFTAAIASYNELGCEKKPIDVSQYFSIHDNLACAGNEETYNFCKNVLKEIFELFPSKYIHLGGDEALKTKWYKCNMCQQAIKDNNLAGEESLQGYFTNTMKDFCKQYGKVVINWNDGFMAHNLDSDIIMQYWKEGASYKKVMLDESKLGREIIFSPFFSYYFDYPYGMTSLQKTYSYKIPKDAEKNCMGLEATLWTEYVDSIQKFEKMVYPRILAVAERAWSNNSIPYNDFEDKVMVFNKVLDSYNIDYEKDYNPKKIKGKLQVVKFWINALNWNSIKKVIKLSFDLLKKKK